MAGPPGLSYWERGGPLVGAASVFFASPTPGALCRRGATFLRDPKRGRGIRDHRRLTALNGPVLRKISVRATSSAGKERVTDEWRTG